MTRTITLPPVSRTTAAVEHWRKRQQQLRKDYEDARHQLNESVQGMLLAHKACNIELAIAFAEKALCFEVLANNNSNATWELIHALGLPLKREESVK